MNFGVIRIYILKEIAEPVRSKFIIMVYLMPTMVMLLFGYGIRVEVLHSRIVILVFFLKSMQQFQQILKIG